MKYFLALLGAFLLQTNGLSQVTNETVVAKQGDGIFLLLRNEGINPAKYYSEFVKLNKDNLIEGSELKVGEEYLLPDAKDSFKKMGRLINLRQNIEKPLFEGEMAKMTLKTDKLRNAVYYLISEDCDSIEKTRYFTQDITKNLARRLLENGAKVYVIAAQIGMDQSDKMEVAQGYVDVINKRFLRNSGKYQRLLMVKANGGIDHKRLNISIYHHDKSDDGERMAGNIQSVFKRYNTNKIVKDSPETFEKREDLFLAKNLLPAITLVEIDNQRTKVSGGKTLSVRPDKNALAIWLGNGIFKDYTDLEVKD